MDELFRFAASRVPNRTDAATLLIETGSGFQERLAEHAGGALTRNAKWRAMVIIAMEELQPPAGPPPNVLAIIAWLLQPIPTSSDAQLLNNVRTFEVDVNRRLDRLPSSRKPDVGSLDAIEKLVKQRVGDRTGPVRQRLDLLFEPLKDVFLALLLFRASGPSQVTGLLKNGKLDLADLLQSGRPSLDEVARLLRLIRLIQIVQDNPTSLQHESDVRAALRITILLPRKIFGWFAIPYAVGFTDLLVVKQHIAGYEMGEIARIENILKGETRRHTTGHTLSNEQDTFLETEKTTQTEEELTVHDQTSIRNDVEDILKEDTKVDAGVHAQYDGAVDIQADLTVSYDKSSDETKKSATDVAKDVTSRAAKKVTDRVLQRTQTNVIETFSENELQEFKNRSNNHISGVYQWIDKVYVCQVFNYGRRMLLDVMVPEPAASLLAASVAPLEDLKPPVPPDPLGTVKKLLGGTDALDDEGHKQLDVPLDPLDLSPTVGDPNYYGTWVAKFQVAGVDPPPPDQVSASKTLSLGAANGNIVNLTGDVQLPAGYRAETAHVSAAWVHDHQNGTHETFVSGAIAGWAFTGGDKDGATPAPGGGTGFEFTQEWDSPNPLPDPQDTPVSIGAVAVTVLNATLSVRVIARATDAIKQKWQLQTYDKIAAAWKQLWDDYVAKRDAVKFQKKQDGILGNAPPETNRITERNELKRSCVAILTKDVSLIDGQDVMDDTKPFPDPDTDAAAEETGSKVRFLEQAFEWDKISYVLYPYFWGRQSRWLDRLQLRYDTDPIFENFLKAGYARVVIPVRPNYEDALSFFLMTGQPWLGGGLPRLGSKMYLPIVEELKEQTGAPGKERPVGDPWEYRIPTRLMKLRTGNEDKELPKWVRKPDVPIPEGPWTWEAE